MTVVRNPLTNLELVYPTIASGTKVYVRNSAGNWVEAANGVYLNGNKDDNRGGRGLFMLGNRFNHARNSLLAPGSGAPTNWAAYNMTFSNYVHDVQADGMNHVEFDFVNNNTSAHPVLNLGSSTTTFTPQSDMLLADNGKVVVDGAIYLALISSTNLGVISYRAAMMPASGWAAADFNQSGRWVGTPNIYSSLTSSLQRFGFSNSWTYNDSFPYIVPHIRFGRIDSGLGFSGRLRIGWYGLDSSGAKYNNPGQAEVWIHTPAGQTNGAATGKLRPIFPEPLMSGQRRKFTVLIEFKHVPTARPEVSRADLVSILTGGQLYGAGTIVATVDQVIQTTANTSFELVRKIGSAGSKSLGSVGSGDQICRLAVMVDESTITAALNGVVQSYSDGLLTGLTANAVTDLCIGGDDIYLRRTEVFYHTFSTAQLQILTKVS